MSILDTIASRLGFSRQPVSTFRTPPEAPPLSGRVFLRRWDAATTTRLNEQQWCGVDLARGTINQDLLSDLPVLCARATHEYHNDGMARGIVRTFVSDLVGKTGPQIAATVAGIDEDDEAAVADAKRWADEIEAAWRPWWADADARGIVSGPDLLAQGVVMFWTCGELAWQIVTESDSSRLSQSESGIRMRLLAIHPQRIDVNANGAQKGAEGEVVGEVVLGVEMDAIGRPTHYHIIDEPDATLATLGYATQRIPARDLIHLFEQDEPGQARGVPWMAPALQIGSDVRDLEANVLDAVRSAADHAILMENEDGSAANVQFEGSVSQSIKRRQITFMVPGWSAKQMKPEQPSGSHIPHVHEQYRKMGRSKCMPLISILADASGANFSSARFSDIGYRECLAETQGWLERRLLSPLARQVEIESKIEPPAKGRGVIGWTWPQRPRIDPNREAIATTMDLANGTLSFFAACRERGRDPEQVMEEHRRYLELADEKGLDPFDWAGAMAGGITINEGPTNANVGTASN